MKNTYSKVERERWVSEVKDLYQKVKSHQKNYTVVFKGFKLEIFLNVFSPKYFNNTKWYAEKLPNIIGESKLLEIGTGTGAIAIHCCKNGIDVTATDINPFAIQCARKNFLINKSNIKLYEGDVYEPISKDSKFDYIFWNHPYNNSTEHYTDIVMSSGFDYNYNSLKKYIQEGHKFLKDPNKGLLLGTGGQADLESIYKISEVNDYELILLDIMETPLGERTLAPNDFRIYELKKKI